MPLVPTKLTKHARVGTARHRLRLLDPSALEELAELRFGVEPNGHAALTVGDRYRELPALGEIAAALLDGDAGRRRGPAVLPGSNLHADLSRSQRVDRRRTKSKYSVGSCNYRSASQDNTYP